jgi:hydroxymethylglutaryl-CoA lyase
MMIYSRTIASKAFRLRSFSSSTCKIVEVGARDGLQNEATTVSADDKVKLIHLLTDAGCSTVEVGAFVSPKWVPQMADSMEILDRIGPPPREGVSYSCLVPNVEGMARAASNPNCTEVAIFASASESFSQKNINCSIQESIERFEPIMELAVEKSISVRGYVSCVVGCPYEGSINIKSVCEVSEKLLGMGCYEISLGDTIGVGTPYQVKALLQALRVRQIAR